MVWKIQAIVKQAIQQHACSYHINDILEVVEEFNIPY